MRACSYLLIFLFSCVSGVAHVPTPAARSAEALFAGLRTLLHSLSLFFFLFVLASSPPPPPPLCVWLQVLVFTCSSL